MWRLEEGTLRYSNFDGKKVEGKTIQMPEFSTRLYDGGMENEIGSHSKEFCSSSRQTLGCQQKVRINYHTDLHSSAEKIFFIFLGKDCSGFTLGTFSVS